MANDYFQFKEFTVYQDKCSMKVCTDSCLLGAWVAEKISSRQIDAGNVLDIGAGTGVLSLMIAQKSPAYIDAIEIEENAFVQARDNFSASPWSPRLQAFYSDATIFKQEKKYDLIISNPPFYENDVPSVKRNKNIAMHNAGLTFDVLIAAIKRNLSCQGSFVLLLPFHRMAYFEKLALENNFFPEEKLLVRPSLQHHFFRAILLFGETKMPPLVKELCIKKDTAYTEDFTSLLKDYYLYL